MTDPMGSAVIVAPFAVLDFNDTYDKVGDMKTWTDIDANQIVKSSGS